MRERHFSTGLIKYGVLFSDAEMIQLFFLFAINALNLIDLFIKYVIIISFRQCRYLKQLPNQILLQFPLNNMKRTVAVI